MKWVFRGDVEECENLKYWVLSCLLLMFLAFVYVRQHQRDEIQMKGNGGVPDKEERDGARWSEKKEGAGELSFLASRLCDKRGHVCMEFNGPDCGSVVEPVNLITRTGI